MKLLRPSVGMGQEETVAPCVWATFHQTSIPIQHLPQLRRFQRVSEVEELHCHACQVSYFIHSALKYHDPAFVAVTCDRLSCFLVNVFHERTNILLRRSN